MANEEHLSILKEGVEVWNKWREENPDIFPELSEADNIEADLIRANLVRANLSFANLSFANLSFANLSGATVIEADLSFANLSFANLSFANLSIANLSFANLSFANLAGANLAVANLSGANVREARLYCTIFANVDLSAVKGLESVHHRAPSTIGIDTIFNSKGKIPEVFLRGAGVPEIFISSMQSLVAENPIQFYSCFMSYGDNDRDFADRLYADLQAKGIRVWCWHEDHTFGAKTWKEIGRVIRLYDKLVVICSQEALNREPVIKEIERALHREIDEKKEILFPIRVDDFVLNEWNHYLKEELVNRNVGDFRDWDTDKAKYKKSLNRLMKGLGKKDVD